jgi:hypothetical protein
MNHGSVYRTRPMEKLLNDTFGEDQFLFGGHTEWDEMATKVAVISTTSVDQHPVVISNYNRSDRPDLGEFHIHLEYFYSFAD